MVRVYCLIINEIFFKRKNEEIYVFNCIYVCLFCFIYLCLILGLCIKVLKEDIV